MFPKLPPNYKVVPRPKFRISSDYWETKIPDGVYENEWVLMVHNQIGSSVFTSVESAQKNAWKIFFVSCDEEWRKFLLMSNPDLLQLIANP